VTVDRITEAMLADGGRFSTLLTMVVESPAFQTRRGDDDSELDAAARAAVPEIPPPEKRRPDPRRFRRFNRQFNNQEFDGRRRGRRDEDGERRRREELQAEEREAERTAAEERTVEQRDESAINLDAANEVLKSDDAAGADGLPRQEVAEAESETENE
jgi:hypothetical protein